MISHLSSHHSVEVVPKQVTCAGSPADGLDFAMPRVTICEMGRSVGERVHRPLMRFATAPLLLPQPLQEQAEAAETSLVY